MPTKARKSTPAMVLRDGRPTAVILDIKTYEDMLERLEQTEDLKALRTMRKKPLKFRELDAFLGEYEPRASSSRRGRG